MVDHNVHISFDEPTEPPRQRRWTDVLWIIFAAGLIGAASGSSVIFAIVAAIGIFCWTLTVATPNNTNSSNHSEDNGTDTP